jgi:hypothetical protein
MCACRLGCGQSILSEIGRPTADHRVAAAAKPAGRQPVEPSGIARGRVEGRGDRGRIADIVPADIVPDDERPSAGGLTVGCGLGDARRIGVAGDRDIRAFLREQDRRRPADPGIGAGDQKPPCLRAS